ncbi:MAG: hypothetical protein EBZ48_15950 [Proteobacteria bacterium]|nr:hypothetical protein [Pseudomonadota bacterium]
MRSARLRAGLSLHYPLKTCSAPYSLRWLALRCVAAMLATSVLNSGLRSSLALAEPLPQACLTCVDLRGWGHLVSTLQRLGVDAVTLREIYADPRMPRFGHIPFSVAPRESHSIYAGFFTAQRLALASQQLGLHHSTFMRAAQRFGVAPGIVAAILLVESGFGLNTGQELVINRLSRMAGLNTKENIEYNFHRLRSTDPTVTRQKLAERAQYLESTFAPEIVALITLSRQNNTDLFTLRGSFAGAFGIPQFLPSSYLRFGVDGDADGQVSLYDLEDAIFSAAHFLASAGWRESLPLSEKRKVIWRYNKSDEYISMVLKISDHLASKHSIAWNATSR